MANEARNRLRSMGGIMASSPELLQAQQGYQDGGNVSPTVPVVGGPDRAMRMQQMEPGGGLTFAEWMELSRREREDLGYPVSPLGGQLYFPNRGTRMLPKERAELPGTAELAEQLEEDTPRQAARRFSEPTPGPDPLDRAEQLEERAENLGRRGPGRGGGATAQQRLLEEAEALREDARAAATRRALDDLSGEAVPDRPQGDKSTVDTTDDERAAATRRALEDLETQLDPAPDPADNTPKAKRTLRERYEKRMELFKDIFGESDEARARDRAMSLAMTGLAIASGQSPNALTNIAQGAAAGLQGMSEQEQARREQERGLKTLALGSAIDQMSAADEAEAEAERLAQERQTELDVARIKAVGEGGGTSQFNRDDTPADVYREVFNTLSRIMPPAEAQQKALEQARNHLVLVSPRLTEGQLADQQRALQALMSSSQAGGPTVEQRIEQLQAEGRSDEEIAAGLRAKNLDPADYGL